MEESIPDAIAGLTFEASNISTGLVRLIESSFFDSAGKEQDMRLRVMRELVLSMAAVAALKTQLSVVANIVAAADRD